MEFIGSFGKKKPQNPLKIMGFKPFLELFGIYFGGDAGIRTPDTADMSRML